MHLNDLLFFFLHKNEFVIELIYVKIILDLEHFHTIHSLVSIIFLFYFQSDKLSHSEINPELIH